MSFWGLMFLKEHGFCFDKGSYYESFDNSD